MIVAILVRTGAAGVVVTALQARLKELGFEPGPVDGEFGPATEQAVRSFQQARGLEVDGVVGVDTASALELVVPAISVASPTLVNFGLVAEERFGLHVSECSAPGAPARWGPVAPRPVHSANSLHYQSRAFDAGGSAHAMRDFSAWLVTNFAGSVAELIHNPNGSVKDGQVVDAGFWGDQTWAAHADHIHLAI